MRKSLPVGSARRSAPAAVVAAAPTPAAVTAVTAAPAAAAATPAAITAPAAVAATDGAIVGLPGRMACRERTGHGDGAARYRLATRPHGYHRSRGLQPSSLPVHSHDEAELAQFADRRTDRHSYERCHVHVGLAGR